MAGIEGLDTRLVTAVSLEEFFVDKVNGLPLAGGSLEFFQDVSRTTPKLVYQLTGSPSDVGGYSYQALPNPVPLSAAGTVNSGGNNVALYYFPYQGSIGESDGTIDLYYVVVKDSFGVVQFTREAVPNSILADDIQGNDNGVQTNQVSNGQFVDFTLLNDAATTISFTGASTQTFNICADWALSVAHGGDGSVLVERENIAGSSNTPTNPPYWLKVTPGANITTLQLIQRFNNNPGIWAQTSDGVLRYASIGILLAANSTVVATLAPSIGSSTLLLNQTNASGIPTYYSNTAQLNLSTNTNTGANGYTSLVLEISPINVTRLSSVQVTSSLSSQVIVPYVQETVNRQQDYTYHTYKDALMFKPIPSHLVGWDFPLNPAQFGGPTSIAGVTAIGSRYVWDQTILFQSVAAGMGVTRTSTLGSLQVQCAVNGAQFALVQYLPREKARALLRNSLSARVSGCTNQVGGLGLTVSLWYTTDVNLPAIGSNNSIVLTLDSNGKPATRNGTWVEVAPSTSVPKYGVLPFGSDNEGSSLDFSYWDSMADTAAAKTATWFAIVVGTKAMTLNSVAQFRSISLVPGRIATQPAPQSKDEVLRECMYYYQKSYAAGTNPATASAPGFVTGVQACIPGTGGGSGSAISASFEITLKAIIRKIPSITMYAYDGTVNNLTLSVIPSVTFIAVSANVAAGSWTQNTGEINTNCAAFIASTLVSVSTTNGISGYIIYHYEADARLGVLN